MKTIIFLLLSLAAFAQKDTIYQTKKVVVIDSIFYVQTIVTNIRHEPLNSQLLQNVERFEQEKARKIDESIKNEVDRKELVKLLKEALKKGYKPKNTNSFEDNISNRILNKIKKENL